MFSIPSFASNNNSLNTQKFLRKNTPPDIVNIRSQRDLNTDRNKINTPKFKIRPFATKSLPRGVNSDKNK